MLRGKVSSCHIEIHSFLCVVTPFHSLVSLTGKAFLQIVSVETPTSRQIFELEVLNVFEGKEWEKIGEACEF